MTAVSLLAILAAAYLGYRLGLHRGFDNGCSYAAQLIDLHREQMVSEHVQAQREQAPWQ